MHQFPVAVIMERRSLQNRWADEAWEAVGVVPAFEGGSATGAAADAPRKILTEADRDQWLFAGFQLELFRDEVDNYFLNMSSPIPKVFVMWRKESDVATPATVSVSYGEAARWLDSGEQVDGIPMSRELADWVGDFVNTHYKPAPRKKVRRNDPLAQDRGRA
ncbi:MAG: DUF3305 domain-containing protein [Azoarcus sp.]|nr:DUF3305 domain-containing protein [Azoarcus sp.]